MNKLLKYGFMASILAVATACSEDYLETAPQSNTTPATVFASPESAQYAINGLGRLMATQYVSQGLNGEGTVMLYQGEYQGDTQQKCNLTGWSNTINGLYHTNETNANMVFAWHYNYRLIGNANTVISQIGEDREQNKDWAYVKAQALCYRAHAYLHLVQIYSRRWSDRNGAQRGVVLRLTPSTDPMPCSSLADVYAQIYQDCDDAARLFAFASVSRSDNWIANENVAHAIKSRAALNREDWSTAASEAVKATQGTKLMSTEEYYGGFNTPNSEWIWSAFNDATQDMYYYSFFAYCGANSNTTSCRSNPVAISRQLVEKIPAEDTRLKLYCIPTAEEMPKYVEQVSGSGQCPFTAEKALNTLKENIDKATTDEKRVAAQHAYENAVQVNDFYNRIKADPFLKARIYATTTIFYYLNTKFQNTGGYGIGNVCLYRAAEMLYNEAEAQYRLGNETAAKAALEKAVKPYQENYSCTTTGAALLDEILTYRAYDLIGEGFSWFDLKRRGVTMERKSWKDGGSWNASFAITVKPEDANNWTFIIPKIETDYNDKVTPFEPDNWTPDAE